MFIGFTTLLLSMITLPVNAYCSPNVSFSNVAIGDDVFLSVNCDSYIQNYSGNNVFSITCDNLRSVNELNAKIGDYPVLSYVYTITNGDSSYDFVIQYEFGVVDYDTISCTTFARTFGGYLGTYEYDSFKSSNLYLRNAYIQYNNGTQYFGDIYYTGNDYYSTSRQNVSGWNLTANTQISEFNFGFSVCFFPPNFVDENTSDNNYYQNGYDDGYREGQGNGYSEGYSDGLASGNESGYHDGYQIGYGDGRDSVIEEGATASIIFNGIISVGLLPVNVFLRILNFEVFGINIGAFVSSLLTIAVVIIIVRMFTGGKGSDS